MGTCTSAPKDYGDGNHPEVLRDVRSRGKSQRTQNTGASSAHQEETENRFANRSVMEGLAQAYTVKHLLGSGAGGNTWLCVDQAGTQELIATKMIKLPLPVKLVQAIFREIKIQAELGDGHLNIIKPKEVVLTSHYLGLVMEYAAGGSLTQYVTRKYKERNGRGLIIDEDEARYFFRQIVSAVDFCHQNHVVHRDLKLDNTLLSAHDPPRIKLCDFGFSRGWGEDSHFSTVIGTPDYMSPQLTAAKMQDGRALYDGIKADVWAMGVLLCVMLVGKFPFEGSSVDIDNCNDPMKKVWLQQTSSSSWRDNEQLADSLTLLSPDVTDLLDRMFDMDERRRHPLLDQISDNLMSEPMMGRAAVCDIATIQRHPWFLARCAPHYEAALAALQKEQGDIDAKAAAGAFKSKQRDQAIANLIRTAASDEFRRQAAAPINNDTVFNLFARIGLTNVQPTYPKVDRHSIRIMRSELERRKSLMAMGRQLMDQEGMTADDTANPSISSRNGSLRQNRLGSGGSGNFAILVQTHSNASSLAHGSAGTYGTSPHGGAMHSGAGLTRPQGGPAHPCGGGSPADASAGSDSNWHTPAGSLSLPSGRPSDSAYGGAPGAVSDTSLWSSPSALGAGCGSGPYVMAVVGPLPRGAKRAGPALLGAQDSAQLGDAHPILSSLPCLPAYTT